jgi:hypothetical protein
MLSSGINEVRRFADGGFGLVDHLLSDTVIAVKPMDNPLKNILQPRI